MIISLISLLLLAVALFFLIKTKPNLYLYEFMKEVCGKTEKNPLPSEELDKIENKLACISDKRQQD